MAPAADEPGFQSQQPPSQQNFSMSARVALPKDRRPATQAEATVPQEGLDPLLDMDKHPDALRRSFEHHFAGVRKATGLDAQHLRDHKQHVFGAGVLAFTGPTSVQSVVRISDDANDRSNPRTLVPEHMARLRESINKGKHDWDKPVVVEAPHALLSKKMKADLKKTPTFQRVLESPYLTLNNVSDEEIRISNEVTYGRVDGAPPHEFLADEEILERRNQLHQLRLSRPMCRLINGNHRIHVCIERAQLLYGPLLEEVTSLQKRVFRDGEKEFEQELKDKAALLREVADQQTWHVLVIADNAPESLKLALMTNYDTDPQMGAVSGEAVWMIAAGIEAAFNRRRIPFPNESRGETLDRVHNELEDRRKKRQLTLKLDEGQDDGAQATEEDEGLASPKIKGKRGKGSKKGKKSKKGKSASTPRTGVVGGAAGKEMWHRVITEPVMMEMLLSTKACLLAYTPQLMGTTYVNTLLHLGSGILAAEFWLSVETLLKIANASNPAYLAKADDFLLANQQILPGGYPRAVGHWEALRSISHSIPLGLAAYTTRAADKFGEFWGESFPTAEENDTDLLDRKWDSPTTLVSSRSALDAWGRWIVKQDLKNETYRRLGTAARLLARLPTWPSVAADASIPRDINYTLYYFPRATLPSKQIIAQWVRIAGTLDSGASGAFELLEFAVDPIHHMWSTGSGDPSTKCRSNWYGSGRGTFFILMLYFQAEHFGCIEARLSEVSQALLITPSTHEHADVWAVVLKRRAEVFSPFPQFNFFTSVHTLYLVCMGSGDVHRAMLYANRVINPAHTLNGAKATKRNPHIDGLKISFGAAKGTGFKPTLEAIEMLELDLTGTGATTVEGLLVAMKKAKGDLRKYIKEASPDSSALRTLLAKHPALRIISDEFWFSAAIIWWGLGWDNSSAQRQGHTAGVIMGWGLLHDAYQNIVLAPLSYHRRAWPLIRAAEAACGAISATPWWIGQLEEHVLRAERIQFLNDLAEGREWVDNEASVAGSGDEHEDYISWLEPSDHVKLPPAAGDSEVEPEPGNDAATGVGTAEEARKTERLDGSKDDLAGAQTKAAKPGASKPRTGSRSAKAGQTIKSKETISDSGSEAKKTPAAAVEKGRDHSASWSIQDTNVDEEQELAEPEPGPSPLKGKKKSGWPTQDDTELNYEAEEPYEDYNDLRFMLGAGQEDYKLIAHPSEVIHGTSQRQIIQSFHPHPFTLTGWISAQLLPGYIGQLIAARAEFQNTDDGALFDGLLRAETQMYSYLAHVLQTRRGFRHDICIQIGSMLDGSSPLESLLDRLAPTLYLLKITFIKNVAIKIMQVTGIPYSIALTEAVWMASDDGLFGADQFSWDRTTGCVYAELLACFPKDWQPSVPEGGRILIGQLAGDDRLREAWAKVPNLTHVALGQGATELQALEGGVIAGAVLGFSALAAHQPNGRIVLLDYGEHGRGHIVNGRNQADAFRRLGTGDGQHTLPQELGFRMSRWTARYTQQPSTSFLSTGRIFSNDFKIPKVNKAERLLLKTELNKISEKFHKHWKNVKLEEFDDHTRMLRYFKQEFPTYQVSIPPLGSIRWLDTPDPVAGSSQHAVPSQASQENSEGSNRTILRRRPGKGPATQNSVSSSVRHFPSAQPQPPRSAISSKSGGTKFPSSAPNHRRQRDSSSDEGSSPPRRSEHEEPSQDLQRGVKRNRDRGSTMESKTSVESRGKSKQVRRDSHESQQL
ncbi:hypothetical protein BDV93DRAFT_565872 [Ceratobasidium sp. AG-I]|nr:hypothetical protein BDV93DRAFT_565872 [Ceratobasidium sp. AG-I]